MFREKFYCGLDIGSQRAKAGIIKVKDPDNIELIDVIDKPTYGFKEDSVSDISELSECVHRTVSGISKKAGVKVKEVSLGLGGGLIDVRDTTTTVPLIDRGSKVITNRDIKNISSQARMLGINMEEEVLHDIAQEFKVDDSSSALNPIGLYGRKLGIHSLIVVANVNKLRNITKAVNHSGYDVGNIFFGSYSSADVVLNQEEKKNGCIMIDIGSRITSVLIFKDRTLRFFKKINFGGDDFTRSVASELKLPFDLAEEIKISNASAVNYDLYEDEEILIRKGSDYIPIKRSDIYNSIRPQADLLVNIINDAIRGSGYHGKLNCGITLVGGGSLMPGLIEKVGEKVNMPVKLGNLNLFTKGKINDIAVFLSVAGLAYSSFKKTLRYSITSNVRTSWTKSLASKIRELYLEYF